MGRQHNATAAHLDLAAYAERTKIGNTFHKPAPVRVTVRQPHPFIARLYAILVAFNLG